MVARRRGPERLSAAFSVRLPPALLAAVDAFVVKANEGDPLGVDPIGRTDVIRRALAAYLSNAAAVIPLQNAQGGPLSRPAGGQAPGDAKSPPRGAQGPNRARAAKVKQVPKSAQEDPFALDLAAFDFGELAPLDFDKGEK